MNNIDIQEQVIHLNLKDYTDKQLDKIKSEIENIIKYYNPESIAKVEIRDYRDISTFKEFNIFIKTNFLLWDGTKFTVTEGKSSRVAEIEDIYNVRLKPFL